MRVLVERVLRLADLVGCLERWLRIQRVFVVVWESYNVVQLCLSLRWNGEMHRRSFR